MTHPKFDIYFIYLQNENYHKSNTILARLISKNLFFKSLNFKTLMSTVINSKCIQG